VVRILSLFHERVRLGEPTFKRTERLSSRGSPLAAPNHPAKLLQEKPSEAPDSAEMAAATEMVIIPNPFNPDMGLG